MSSRMLRWVSVAVVALAFSGWATAQEKKTEAKPEAKKDEPKKNGKDIVQTLMDSKDPKCATLCDLLKAAGLDATLKEKGPYTLFAPTDEAFAKVDKATLEDWKKPANKEKLANILKYHVVKGKEMAAAIEKMKECKPMHGGEIKVTVKDGKIMLNDKVNVTKTNIEASNGVIHVVDTVLMPAEKKPEAKPEAKPAEKKP